MGFGVLSAGQRLLIKLDLLGGPKTVATTNAVTGAFSKMSGAVKAASASTLMMAKSSRAAAASSLVAARSNSTLRGSLTALRGGMGSMWTAMTKQTAANKRMTAAGLAYNQVLFTLRRATFYGTLALVGMTAAVLKLGFSYNEAMDSARVSLEKVIKPTQVLDAELRKLFLLAAVTPFTFEDTTKAFRRMYFALHPVGVSIKTINGLLTGMTDILSASGNVTPAALNRVSVALTKMGTQGYLTGRVVQSLTTSGINVGLALQKHFHLTAEELGNIGSLRLPANSVMQALIEYSRTAAFRGQALAQANKTIFGAFSSFKDLLSMSVGAKEAGPMEGIRKLLFGVNQQLFSMLNADKPVSITRIAQAFDQQLTPKSHALINVFTLLEYTLKTVIFLFKWLFIVIAAVLIPLDWLTKQFGANRLAAKWLGRGLGLLITAFILLKTIQAGSRAADELWNAKWIAAIRLRVWWITKAIIPAMYRWIAAQTGLDIAALANPWVLMFLAVMVLVGGLVILYYKWKRFHDFVDKTYNYIKTNQKQIELALIVALGPIGVAAAASIAIIANLNKIISLAHKVPKWLSGQAGPLKYIAHPFGTPSAAQQQAPANWSLHSLLTGNDPASRKLSKRLSWRNILEGGFKGLIGLASGGTISSGGLAMVGEAGPELVHLPAGASVIPATRGGVSPIGNAVASGMGNRPPEVIQLVVDRKVLAQVVAHARQDELARK